MKKWKQFTKFEKGATIAGGATVLYLLYRGITAGSNIKRAPVNYGQIPVVYSAGGGGVLWDADPLSQEISNNLEGYNLNVYPETTDKILALQDEQLKLLYNHYNTYYAEDYPTLTQLIENEWSDYGGSYDRAVSRLKSLGLNEGFLSGSQKGKMKIRRLMKYR